MINVGRARAPHIHTWHIAKSHMRWLSRFIAATYFFVGYRFDFARMPATELSMKTGSFLEHPLMFLGRQQLPWMAALRLPCSCASKQDRSSLAPSWFTLLHEHAGGVPTASNFPKALQHKGGECLDTNGRHTAMSTIGLMGLVSMSSFTFHEQRKHCITHWRCTAPSFKSSGKILSSRGQPEYLHISSSIQWLARHVR